MWSRVIEVMFGVWLLISPFIFSHPASATGWWINDMVAGGGVILFGLLSFWHPTRNAHLLSLLVGCWLIGFAYYHGLGDAPPASQNHLAVGFMLLMLLVATHVIWLVERQRNSDFPHSYIRGIWEAIWWAAVTVTTVGYGDKTPKGVIGRIFGLFWMFAGLFLVAQFTASLTTALAVQELRGAISTVADLPGKRVATVAGSTSSDYLRRFNVWQIDVDEIQRAYSLLETGEVQAILYDAPTLQYHATTAGRGKVQVVGHIFEKVQYGIALSNGSPYRDPINIALLDIIESGEYDALYTEWFGGESANNPGE